MAPHPALDLITKEKETEHVEQDVRDASVGEHVSEKLPVPTSRDDISRTEHHIAEGSRRDVVNEKNKYVQADYDERGVIELILKWASHQ